MRSAKALGLDLHFHRYNFIRKGFAKMIPNTELRQISLYLTFPRDLNTMYEPIFQVIQHNRMLCERFSLLQRCNVEIWRILHRSEFRADFHAHRVLISNEPMYDNLFPNLLEQIFIKSDDTFATLQFPDAWDFENDIRVIK